MVTIFSMVHSILSPYGRHFSGNPDSMVGAERTDKRRTWRLPSYLLILLHTLLCVLGNCTQGKVLYALLGHSLYFNMHRTCIKVPVQSNTEKATNITNATNGVFIPLLCQSIHSPKPLLYVKNKE